MEVEAYANIKDKNVFKFVSKFVWKNIVCQFGVPQAIVVDNRPQFDSIVFQTFYSELNIKNLYSTPCYPQSNRQAEAIDKTQLNALKKILEDAKGKWVDELPTWVTLFALAYGMEVIIPTEIGMSTTKTVVQVQMDNDEKLIRQLDWANEIQGDAAIWMASYR